MQECLDQVSGSGSGGVGRGGGGNFGLGWEPDKGVSNAFGCGLFDPNSIAAIVMQGRAEVPTIDGVR